MKQKPLFASDKVPVVKVVEPMFWTPGQRIRWRRKFEARQQKPSSLPTSPRKR